MKCKYFCGMNEFYPMQVVDVRKETADCVSVALKPADGVSNLFAFKPGQYLTLKADINGKEVRRSYSLCSAPHESEWRVAIKKVPNGEFSTWANESLKEGMTLEAMAPNGKFILNPTSGDKRSVLGFAAGSGITPILSHIKSLLKSDATSHYTLFYVNKDSSSVIFKESIQELKDEYLNRFSLFHILTREPQDIDLFNGRLDENRCRAILNSQWVDFQQVADVYLCGPEEMIWACKRALEVEGMASENIHFELFTSSKKSGESVLAVDQVRNTELRRLAIVLDGVTTMVEVPENKSIVDAALDAGLDAPYSCLGGVCCTCRAKMTQGEVAMDVNYALESDEVEAGFVLTCQSKLRGTGPFEVDYDQQ